MKKLLPVLALLAIGTANAQNVGVGTNAPHPSAKLDISANADPSARGLLIPQMNLASASFPAPGPATSLLVYNTNAGFGGGVGYFYNEGTPASPVWRRLTNGSNAVGSVAASAPITSSGGVNPTISIPQANGTTDGFLDAADWTAFNNKVSGVAASAPITSTGGVNPTIGIPQATAAVDGFLDNADWNTFNNKLTTVTTNPRLTGLGTSGNPLDMAIVGTAGTYTKVTTDAYGRVVSAGTLAPGDIPTGSGNYIQNQFASGQSGSFWIGGQGKFGNGTTVYGDRMEVREGVNGNGFAYIDFRGDDNFTDFGLRLIRGNTGANTTSDLVHRGSGNLNITAQDNGVIAFNTSNVERMRVSATQPFVGIGTNNPQHNLTLGGTNQAVFGVENTATFSAKNSAGAYENYLWPRWSDNVMYMNFGTGGFNLRNNASATAMFIDNSNTVNISRGVLFDCNDCGDVSTLNGSANWGDLTIQGRVISTNSNLHLSPPNGNYVFINTTYRAAGGTAGGRAHLNVDGRVEGWGVVPIGSIIAWNGSMGGTPALPVGWQLCNGSTISDAESPYNGQATPNLNNTASSSFGGSAGGRYLRGSNSSGGFQNDRAPDIQVETTASNTGCNACTIGVDGQSTNWSGWQKSYYWDDATRYRYSGGEVRPLSYTVIYIMRIK